MKSTQIATDALNKVVELFKSGNLPACMSEILARNPADPRPCAKWSVSNNLIMAFSGTKDARGFRQWQQVGRFVKKGSHAVYILAPNSFPVEREIKREDGTTEKVKRMVLHGFRGQPVFRFEDTDGAPLIQTELPPLPPLKYAEVADKLGIKVSATFSGAHGGAYGWYAHGLMAATGKEIALASPEQSVWFHELAHAIDHHLRGNDFDIDPKEESEAVAEMAAATMAYINGYRTEEMSFAKTYIEAFLGKNNWETNLMGLMNRIGEVVTFAITGGE